VTESSPGAKPAIVTAEAGHDTLKDAILPDQLTEQIGVLEALSIEQLRSRWTEAYGMPPPANSRRDFVVRGLAHRLQQDALGGLAPALRRRLVQLSLALESGGGDQFFAAPRIKPGTRLLRQWHGAVHQVTVLENGFAYRGERYLSLSAIARTITGTRWSGPVFFGLRTRRRRYSKTRG
jgi:hypothetical protein